MSREEQIAKPAHELWQQRNGEHGNEVNTETIRQTGFKQNEKSTNGINGD